MDRLRYFVSFKKLTFVVKNTSLALRISLTVLAVTGYWTRTKEVGAFLKYGYPFLTFLFMAGIGIILQFVDLFQVWGDIALMTGTSFLLFTNVALGLKLFNMVCSRDMIRAVIEESDEELQAVDTDWGRKIVQSGNRLSTILFSIYIFLAYLSIAALGWPREGGGELPTRAWYPYNTTTSPGFEITYAHQVIAVCVGALVNVSIDTVVIALMAQQCCRLRLLSTSLTMLGDGMMTSEEVIFEPDQERAIRASIHNHVRLHQAVLVAAARLQKYFSGPIFVQFIVSMIIICVTAYQLAFESSNFVAFVAMTAYFLCMLMQVFMYCFQGHELSDESSRVGGAVYHSPWYKMSVPLRRDLMMLMLRSQRLATITAGGFTTLSLSAFMAIIKTSYTLFTVLVGDD